MALSSNEGAFALLGCMVKHVSIVEGMPLYTWEIAYGIYIYIYIIHVDHMLGDG